MDRTDNTPQSSQTQDTKAAQSAPDEMTAVCTGGACPAPNLPLLWRLPRGWCQWLMVGTLVLLLSACGFHLQGATPLPFDTLSITIPENTPFGASVRRALRANSPNTEIVTAEKGPDGKVNYQAQLQMISLDENQREVSLNPQGRVEEYELTLNFTFRLVDANGGIILPDTTLTAVRDLPYDDSVVQAKESEARSMFDEMLQGLTDRLIRRITAPDVRDNYLRLQQAND